jgi:hypothetical protein
MMEMAQGDGDGDQISVGVGDKGVQSEQHSIPIHSRTGRTFASVPWAKQVASQSDTTTDTRRETWPERRCGGARLLPDGTIAFTASATGPHSER